MTSFVLSIEPVEGKTFIHGFHLGTDERIARSLAEEMFRGRNASHMPTRTVALIRDGKIFDVFDGGWSSDAHDAMWEQMRAEEEIKTCSICGRTYTGFGNNAWPINEGRCCNECNNLVIGARLHNTGKRVP